MDEVKRRISEAYADLARGEFGRGVEALHQVVADHPGSAVAWHAYGAVLTNLGKADLAEPYLRRAVALDPASAPSKVALGLSLLAQQKYEEGWRFYEARDGLPGDDWATSSLPYPEWRGEPIAGRRLLIWPDEGLGDQIQFVRYATVAQAQGADVVVCCSLPLARLFRDSLPMPVAPVTLQVQHPECDLWVRTSLLPARLRLPPAEAPQPPYLRPNAARVSRGARIGVMSRGNPNLVNDRHRSLWPEFAERLLNLPGAMSLHPDDTGAGDFEETASIIAGLDLVISVDTSVAHLAGAMGKPVWVLLSTIGLDWRWGLSGERTAWYPSARLFRQPRINDWAAVIESVERELAA